MNDAQQVALLMMFFLSLLISLLLLIDGLQRWHRVCLWIGIGAFAAPPLIAVWLKGVFG